MLLAPSRIFARRGRLLFVLSSIGGALMAQSESVSSAEKAATMPGHVLEKIRVTESRLTAIDVAGPNAIKTHDADYIRHTGSFSVEEFLERLRPPDEGTEQLILVDGKPAYIDPTALPPSMIESIEISDDGAMPQYGAYANGRIINIRLKKDSTGREVAAKTRIPLAGGGEELTARVAGAVTQGKWRLIYTFDYREQDALFAAERDFSRQQDHRARGGRDLRLSWGYPAVVQSVSGPLSGVVTPEGEPASVALAPAGQSGSDLTPADFIGRAGTAAGQRRFNTAAYRLLRNPSSRSRANLGIEHAFSERLTLSISGSFIDTRSHRTSEPPVSEPSEETQVPAAFNPFGQDVQVGLVHVEFGPTRREARARRSQFGVQLSGQLGDSWKWDASLGYRRDRSHELAHDLDSEKFAAALASPDPAKRFNPFGDARVVPLNASLYPDLLLTRTRDDIRGETELEISLSGPVAEAPGGPVTLDLETELADEKRRRVFADSDGEPPEERRLDQRSAEVSASVNLPFVGSGNARPLVQRLETRLGAELAEESNGGSEVELRADAIWVPASFLLLRGRYATDSETPGRRAVAESETLVGETVIDPRRGSIATPNVEVVTGDVVNPTEEKSERFSFDATFEPKSVEGLEFSVSYQVRRRLNLYEDEFDAQEILNNERAFEGRVTRAAPTPEDIALGRPGTVIAIDATPGNAGQRYSRELEFEFTYRPPWQRFGRFRITAEAERTLESRNEIQPGVIFIDEGGIPRRSPDWEFEGMIAWDRDQWSASISTEYTGPVEGIGGGRAVDSYTTVDFNVSYLFRGPLFGRIGKDASLSLGVDNVFDEPPPYTDTLAGYRDGSPLGRSLSAAVTIPF